MIIYSLVQTKPQKQEEDKNKNTHNIFIQIHQIDLQINSKNS